MCPEDSHVHHVYEALKEEGKSEESAAKIAQAQTGEALATGKPPEHAAAAEHAHHPHHDNQEHEHHKMHQGPHHKDHPWAKR